jgi:ATP-dependent Clp protease adaptor protein ClpS
MSGERATATRGFRFKFNPPRVGVLSEPAIMCPCPKLARAEDLPAMTKPTLAGTETETLPDQDIRTRRIPPYHVILLNDDHHSMEFVVGVLTKVLGCAIERAFQYMLEAHESGRAIIWTGPKEVAELKQEQVHTFSETRERDGADLGPLGCVIEPAPGA